MKRTFKALTVLWLMAAILYNGRTAAQIALEPYIGYSIDTDNREHFSQINTGVQLAVINKPVYKMLVGIQGNFPLFPFAGTDQAFALNPDLPLTSIAKRKTSAQALSLLLSHRWKIGNRYKLNGFSAVLHVGIAEHTIRVRYYGYDKDHYTVLNPQTVQKHGGVFLGAGIHYDRKFYNSRLFAQLTINSPLLTRLDKHDYKTLTPLSLNVGYGFDIGKKKSGKQDSGK